MAGRLMRVDEDFYKLATELKKQKSKELNLDLGYTYITKQIANDFRNKGKKEVIRI